MPMSTLLTTRRTLRSIATRKETPYLTHHDNCYNKGNNPNYYILPAHILPILIVVQYGILSTPIAMPQLYYRGQSLPPIAS